MTPAATAAAAPSATQAVLIALFIALTTIRCVHPGSIHRGTQNYGGEQQEVELQFHLDAIDQLCQHRLLIVLLCRLILH
ncbi:unnamed protein product [Schistocephalus solidus]|uniref:Secreted protein n=1 Tax=Schistocephalus solidus TaxID=70667 RepID=A0A183TNM1_SCHSO|nr:unnamed protein product [Schistocephalus solidus]